MRRLFRPEPFTGRDQPVEGHELQVETDLANILAIPKRTIPDHLLVVLLEERLGWKRLAIETLADKNSWDWVDRQYERKFGQIRQSLKRDPSCEANAWLIDERAPLLANLRRDLQVNTLKTTYRDYLD